MHTNYKIKPSKSHALVSVFVVEIEIFYLLYLQIICVVLALINNKRTLINNLYK